MSACTSPERTSRSTPRRISCPATVACRSSIVSDAHGQHHLHVVAVDPHVVDRAPAGSRAASAARRSCSENVEPCFGHSISRSSSHTSPSDERVVGVRALVADHVAVVADAHDARCGGRRRRSARAVPGATSSTRADADAASPIARARGARSSRRTERRSRRDERADRQPRRTRRRRTRARSGARPPRAGCRGSRGSRAGRRRSGRRSTRASTSRRWPRSRGSGSTPRSRPR